MSLEAARLRLRDLALVALIGTLGVAGVASAHAWAERRAMADLEARGTSLLALQVEVVRGWLGRYRSLAPVYAHDREVGALVRDPGDAAKRRRVEDRLGRWAAASGAQAIAVMNREGRVLAGSDGKGGGGPLAAGAGFRAYFEEAMQGRLGRYLARGSGTGERGYFFSYPVYTGGTPAGAVVVMVPVDPIEQELRASPQEVFVTDEAGVVVLAGHPAWRLRTLGALPEATRDALRESGQFGEAALEPLPVRFEDGEPLPGATARAVPDRANATERSFLHLSRPMTVEGWRAHLLIATDGARAQVATVTLAAAAVLAALALAAALLWQRRRRTIERFAEREVIQRDLEATVAARTADLSETNVRLAREVEDRAAAEAELRRTQAELVQAGKLAALGQMSATLSHEFNQPLAAIRTYADNAQAFLERGREPQARENLSRIGRLTERMAQLSKALTSFARKPRDGIEVVGLRAVVDEALELLRARLEAAGVAPQVEMADDLTVMGGAVRLQHVFMNLIGNALDALGDRGTMIRVAAGTDGDRVRVIVEDDGEGLSPEVMEKMFDPFFSSKEPGRGLGLGLTITYNILRDFGATIRAEPREGGGARFVLDLRPGAAGGSAAEAAE